MAKFGERFRTWREAKAVTGWLIEKRIEYARSNLTNLEKGRFKPSDDVLKRLASIEELEISYTQLRAWRLLDEYSPQEIKAALKLSS